VSMEAGACVAYGILMCDVTHKEPVVVYEEFLEKAANAKKADAFDDITTHDWYPELYARLVEAFALNRLVVPDAACLLYTGTEDDRPARCETPAGEWVLGFGLLQDPDQYPVMDESFKKEARWHTWVWMG